MRNNTAGRHTFIMLAGVYLLYLSWQLFNGFRTGDTTNPVFILAAILFAVIGVIIIVTNIRAIIRLSKEQPAAEETVEDTSVAENSPETPADEASVAENSDNTATTDTVIEEEIKEN